VSSSGSSPHPERAAAPALRALACALALGVATASAAQYANDEVPDLRVTKDAGSVVLAWGQPVTPPTNGYDVRRCLLRSLRAGYYGNCVAQNLSTPTWTDASPPSGATFYLAAGVYGSSEGSLGLLDALRYQVVRTAPPCDQPEVAQPLDLVVRLPAPLFVCGVQVRVRFPTDAVALTTGECTNFLMDAAESTNVDGDQAVQVCATAVGAMGSGEMLRFHFQRSDCPVPLESFSVLECQVLVGTAGDCAEVTAQDGACVLRLQ
jgi:hypothetical protein